MRGALPIPRFCKALPLVRLPMLPLMRIFELGGPGIMIVALNRLGLIRRQGNQNPFAPIDNQGSVMKKTLIILCSATAIALVGCDRNEGGAGSDSTRDSGFGSSRDTTYPASRSMTRDTNSTSLNSPSSSITTNTNSAVGAPGQESGNSSSGTSSSSGTQPPAQSGN